MKRKHSVSKIFGGNSSSCIGSWGEKAGTDTGKKKSHVHAAQHELQPLDSGAPPHNTLDYNYETDDSGIESLLHKSQQWLSPNENKI